MAQPTFRELITAIKKGNASPVNILMGEEAYYIDCLVTAFEANVIDEADKDFNFNVFYGNDADIDGIIACCQQFPVMASKKLVILKEAQSMMHAKSQLEKLAPYVKRPNQTTVFVVAYKGEDFKASSALIKAANESKSVIFKSPLVRDYQLPEHVKDYCSSKGVNVDGKSVALLCEYIGGPLSKLFGEVNKLIQIKGSDKRITSEDIEKNIGISKDYNNFELTKAVAEKDYPKTMKILKYFQNNPKSNPTLLITSTLFTLFQRIVIYYYTADRSDKNLMSALAMKNVYGLRDIKTGAAKYTASQAVNAIHAIREFDAKSKGIGSYQNEYQLLGELLFKIFTTN